LHPHMPDYLRWLLVMAILALSACQPGIVIPTTLSERIELTHVPFFAQADYQCGPAALATVLRSTDVEITPEALVPLVYLPARKGSLRTELIAAARTFDRVPYPLASDLTHLLAEVDAGRPVLVLQNLGLVHWPMWHFAVVVGFDRAREELILRSGTERRLSVSASRFERSWARAGRWALVVLRPDELPRQPDPERYLAAAAGLEAIGRLDAAQVAYQTARDTWPESAWPLLGLANLAYLRNRFGEAQGLYRQVIERDPSNVSARYNLADTLAQMGCAADARMELETALDIAADTAMLARVRLRLSELDQEPKSNPSQGRCKPP
jgi:tetratricopeptide (TPR) repeat protein